MALSQRLTIDVHKWTSSYYFSVEYGGLRGCSTTVSGDAQSFAASLPEGHAVAG